MKKEFKKLLFYIIITFLIGNFFAIFINSRDFYSELNKPLDVPSYLFPIVWSILYLLMSISAYIISKKDNKTNKIYFIQLIVNSLWTLLFFGFKLYTISFLWILLLIVLVAIMILKFYRIDKIAGVLNIPYLLWLLFAAYLNFSIAILN